MNFSLMNDDEILSELAGRIDLLRRSQQLTDKELVEKSGSSLAALNRLRSDKSGISLLNFVRLLRGLGLLERLDKLLEVDSGYSPAAQTETELPKRIRKKKSRPDDFVWGDDES